MMNSRQFVRIQCWIFLRDILKPGIKLFFRMTNRSFYFFFPELIRKEAHVTSVVVITQAHVGEAQANALAMENLDIWSPDVQKRSRIKYATPKSQSLGLIMYHIKATLLPALQWEETETTKSHM